MVAVCDLEAAHQRLQVGVEPLAAADEAHAHALGDEPRALLLDVAAEEPHQADDLGGGPLPVLGREGEERQVADGEVRAALDDLAHALGPALVTGKPRQSAARGPAAVAVHDDRDVTADPHLGFDAIGFSCTYMT